jgi:hypothetical protein
VDGQKPYNAAPTGTHSVLSDPIAADCVMGVCVANVHSVVPVEPLNAYIVPAFVPPQPMNTTPLEPSTGALANGPAAERVHLVPPELVSAYKT